MAQGDNTVVPDNDALQEAKENATKALNEFSAATRVCTAQFCNDFADLIKTIRDLKEQTKTVTAGISEQSQKTKVEVEKINLGVLEILVLVDSTSKNWKNLPQAAEDLMRYITALVAKVKETEQKIDGFKTASGNVAFDFDQQKESDPKFLKSCHDLGIADPSTVGKTLDIKDLDRLRKKIVKDCGWGFEHNDERYNKVANANAAFTFLEKFLKNRKL